MQIHILAFLFFAPPFFACQQDQEKTLSTAAANIAFQSVAAGLQSPEKARTTAANIIFQSTDGGLTWEDVSAGLPQDLQAFCVYADGGKVLLGSESGLYHKTNPPMAQAWEKEAFLDERITNILPGKAGPYICSYGSGFFQEMPGTGIWKPMHTYLKDKTILTVLETPDGTLFAGCDSGLFKSADGGATWKQVFADGMVNSLVAADGVLIGGGARGLMRSTDGGEHWDSVLTEDGWTQKTEFIGGRFVAITRGIGTLKEVNEDPERMAARLRTSADGGKTWQRMDANLASVRLTSNIDESLEPVWAVNDIKQSGEYLFCSLDTGVFRSNDQGKTWRFVFPSIRKRAFTLAVSGGVIYAVIGGGC